jgi:hypothetical protein
MKKIIYTITIGFITAFAMMVISSCKKSTFSNVPTVSLTVVNTVTGGTTVKLGSQSTSIFNNSYAQLNVMAGENDLYIWPTGDSAHPYYTYPKFNAVDREVYSIFLGGTGGAVDGIIVKENLPYHSDSTCGVRIMNLSPNSIPLNVTLSTSPTVNEVSNLAYKQYTDFKIYAAKAMNISYTFQIRKASDYMLLTSYTLSTPRFANVTLVIRGLVGSSPTIGVTRVNNDR